MVDCDHKAVILRAQIWSMHSSDVVGLLEQRAGGGEYIGATRRSVDKTLMPRGAPQRMKMVAARQEFTRQPIGAARNW